MYFLKIFDLFTKNDTIKPMKKIILTFISIILLNSSGFTETIPPRHSPLMTKETHPVYFSYFENYANRLKEVLDNNKKLRKRGWGASYRYSITRDGQIINMKGSTFQNDEFDDLIKELILSVKPEPFSQEMESDDFMFDTFLGYYKYNEFDISEGFSIKYNKTVIHITICSKKRKPQKIKASK